MCIRLSGVVIQKMAVCSVRNRDDRHHLDRIVLEGLPGPSSGRPFTRILCVSFIQTNLKLRNTKLEVDTGSYNFEKKNQTGNYDARGDPSHGRHRTN